MSVVPAGSSGSPRSPEIVVESQELAQGDAAVWIPSSYQEWEARERTKTFLEAWLVQVKEEQPLRKMCARAVFGLIALQVVGAFGIVVLQGLKYLAIDVAVLQILLPSVFAEVFGLGLVVTKYLFSQSLRHGLDSLVKGAADANRVTGRP